MKTILFVLAWVCIVVNSSAQNIHNGDFEYWDNFGSYGVPEGWATLNEVLTPVDGNIYVQQSADNVSGTSALKIQSLYSDSVGQVVQGFVGLGSWKNVQDGVTMCGTPFDQNPSHLTMYVKYFPATSNDRAAIVADLSRHDFETDKSIQVANAELTLTDTISEWTQLIIPVNYTADSSQPDSVIIGLLASVDQATAADSSALLIDSIAWVIPKTTTPNAIAGPETTSNIELFPNPSSSSDWINLSIDKNAPSIVNVLSIDGRRITQLKSESGSGRFNTTELTTGIYLLQFYHPADHKLLTKRLVVE